MILSLTSVFIRELREDRVARLRTRLRVFQVLSYIYISQKGSLWRKRKKDKVTLTVELD